MSRLAVRWRSDLPLDVPGGGTRRRLEGRRKKRAVLAAAALLAAIVLWVFLLEPVLIARLREALLEWRI